MLFCTIVIVLLRIVGAWDGLQGPERLDDGQPNHALVGLSHDSKLIPQSASQSLEYSLDIRTYGTDGAKHPH